MMKSSSTSLAARRIETLIIVIGIRRSGLHACVQWLTGLYPGHVRMINDPDPHTSPSLNMVSEVSYEYDVRPDRIHGYTTPAVLREYALNIYLNAHAHLPRFMRGLARRILHLMDPLVKTVEVPPPPPFFEPDSDTPATHIILFENLTPAEAANKVPAWVADYLALHPGVRAPDNVRQVIVLRHPWNGLASNIQSKEKNLVVLPAYGSTWLEFAREVADETNHLAAFGSKPVPILYDHWISSIENRREIASQLGREHNDIGLSKMSHRGGGSSFDGLAEGCPPLGADVTRRWQRHRNHPLMLVMQRDPEINRLCTALQFDLTMPPEK